MRFSYFLYAFMAASSVAAIAHPGHDAQLRPALVDPVAAEKAAIQTLLSRYKRALEALDARGTEDLFAPTSAIYETGGVEGSYANYLAHHLGPELAEFKSFGFSDYKVDVHLLGKEAAHAIETYKYRIETKSGEVIDRLGVATSVLIKENGQWKIVMMHNSGRRPKAS